MSKENKGLGVFEKYLTLWVALCIVAGVLIGVYLPQIPQTLDKFTYAQVSIPVAILIWLMIYPMMLKIDFTAIKNAAKQKKGLAVTCATNWLIKPFTMYAISYFFLLIVFKNIIPTDLAKDYLAGAVLLGAAPCTAMVFVWSHLTKGNAAYTLVQVAVNDIILLVGFVPIVALLLGVTDVTVPWDTLLLSVVLFVIIPFVAGYFSRNIIKKKKGLNYFENVFLAKFNGITVVGLLLTLVILTMANTIYYKKKVKNNYTLDCLILLNIMLIFTYEYCSILTVIFTLLAMSIKVLIDKINQKRANYSKTHKKLPIGFFLCVTNIITLITTNCIIFYKG